MERIIFETEDGVQIVGDYLEAAKGAPTALLLHMMPATRMSWHPFMVKLCEAGFNSLAIDFRGHGESVRGQTSMYSAGSGVTKGRRFDLDNGFKTFDHKKFTDQEQQAKILDVRAAVAWLEKNRGVDKDNLVLIGASIGANLALQYMAEDPSIKKVVLLSPGFNYRGIKTDQLMKKLVPDQRVLLVASDDDEYSFKTVKELNRLALKNSELWEFSGLGHGTTMFERRPELMSEVVGWIKAFLNDKV